MQSSSLTNRLTSWQVWLTIQPAQGDKDLKAINYSIKYLEKEYKGLTSKTIHQNYTQHQSMHLVQYIHIIQ